MAGEVPININLRIIGATDVKAKLAAIKEEFRQTGDIKKYTRDMGALSREARVLTGNLSQQKNVFLAMHPGINTVSRALSTMGRSAHAAMSVMNTLNLANLTLQGSSSDLAGKQRELADAQKEFAEAMLSGDPNKIAEAQKRLGAIQDDIAESTKRNTEQMIQNWVTFGTTMIFTAATVGNTLIELSAKSAKFATFMSNWGAPLGIIAIGVAALAVEAVIMQKLFPSLQGIYDQVGKDLGGKSIFTDIIAQVLLIPIAIGNALDSSITDWETFKAAFADTGFIRIINDAFIEFANTLVDVHNMGVRISNLIHGMNEPMKDYYLTTQEAKDRDKAKTGQFGSPYPWMGQASTKKTYTSFDDFMAQNQRPMTPNQSSLTPSYSSGMVDSGKAVDSFIQGLKDNGVYGGIFAEDKQSNGPLTGPQIYELVKQQIKDLKGKTGAAKDDPIINNSEVVKEATNTAKTEADEAKKRASDNARMHHAAEMSALEAKQATFAQTEATNALRITMAQMLLAKNNTGGGASGGGHSGSGGYYDTNGPTGEGNYLGDNGKYYETQDEADRNNNTGDYAPDVTAARGFNGIINSPTNMLVGEAGPEMVNVTPLGGRIGGGFGNKKGYGGGGGSPCITINIMASGSILATEDLRNMVNKSLKDSLKQVGFD